MPLRRILARPILTRLGGRLRLIVAGGSALDPAVGDKFEAFGITVLQGYGATETSPVISLNLPNNRKTSGVGLPFPSVEVRVAGDGEIAVRGPNVVEGYYQRPEETAARFRDGWYYTDDLGYFDEDGHLHIKGRKKFLIVTPGGENVYPEDLESELNSEPEVKDSAVLAREQDGRFEIHAVLLPVSGAALPNPSQIIERVNERLQPHQRMHGVSVWDGDDFPRTTTRKVKKNDVRNWLEAQGSTATERPAAVAVGAVERAISHATGIPAEEITPEKRMEADLKMDSLGRVTLAGIIEEELGVVLDEGQIAPQTTVADVRALVEHPSQRQERHEFNEQPLTRRAIFWRTLLQRLVLWPIISLFARMTVEGEENIRDLDGPVIFTPNHISPIDGGVLLRMLPARFQARTAIASAADVLYDNPTYGRFKRILELLLNIYPFARQSQVKSSLEYTGRLMDRGFSIMLFPEGHIAMDQHLQPIKRGAGLIAVEMQAPVVPVAMTGIERMVPADSSGLVMPKRARGTVRFGKPIHFHLATDYEAAAREIGESIAALLPEEYQPAPDASPTSD